MRIASSDRDDGARVVHADLTDKDVDAIRDGLETMRTAQDGDKVPENMKALVDFLSAVKDYDAMTINGMEVSDNETGNLSDNFRSGARDAYVRSRSLFSKSQRAWFRDQYAPEINGHDSSFWRFPYTDLSFALLAYEQARFGHITDKEAEELVSSETWKLFKSAWENVHADFDKTFAEIVSGGFIDDSGSAPLKVDTEKGTIDITPIVRALLDNGLDLEDIFGDYDPPLGYEDGSEWVIEIRDDERDGKAVTSYYLSCDSYDKDPDRDYEEGGEEPAILEEAELNIDDVIEESFGFWYLFLLALVKFLNCRKSIRALFHPAKRPGRHRGPRTTTIWSPNDAVTKALMQRGGKQEILPYQYFGDYAKNIEIDTGKNMQAKLTIIVGDKMSFDDLVETYRLGPIDQFWYESIASIAWDGQAVIRGSDMMKLRGWKNPYQEHARKVMKQALRSASKMNSIKVIVDTTSERKGLYRNLAESYGSRAIVSGEIDIMRFDDGTFDFEIRLNTTLDGTPFGALPLAVYAKDKRQIVSASEEEMEFKTVKNLTLEHRMMWSYVMKRLREENTSNTILFDTIFKNIGLEDADRHKRWRMLKTLERMLDERESQGLLAYEWKPKGENKVSIAPTDEFRRADARKGKTAKKALKPSASRKTER